MADEFTCPSGSQWYACPNSGSSSKFVGCCAGGDPCSKGCAEGNIRAASFKASNYGEFPDASCGTNSQFYTCLGPGNATTFWGCCKTVACATAGLTCEGDLSSAFLDQPAQFNFYLSTPTGGSSTTSSASASATSDSKGGKSNGAVIGGAVGGAIGGLLVIGLIVFFIFRRRRQQKQTSRGVETAEAANPYTDGPKAFDPHSPNFAAQSPPPTYSATNGANGDYYQSMAQTGKVNPYTNSPYSQGQWAHNADGPQEMEADVGPSNRYSELPAEATSRPATHHKYSELSTGPSCRVSPQHSPKPSQIENNAEPMPKGLGVMTEGTRS